MRRVRHLRFRITAIFLIAMAIAVFALLAGIRREATSRLPQVIEETAAEHLYGTAAVGKVKVLPSSVILNDVVVSHDGETIIKIPRAKIAFSLIDLVRRRTDPAASIKRIELVQPSIFLERAADGQWNIADMVKPSRLRRPTEFRAKVNVKSGSLAIRDCAAAGPKPAENVLRNIEASLDFSEMPAASFSASGTGQPDRLGRFTAKGRYNADSHSFEASLDLSDASAAYWSGYPWRTGLNVLSGTAQAGIKLSKPGKDKPLDYSGTVRLRSAAVQFRQIRSPARGINGNLNVRNGVVNMRLKGKVGSSPFLVSGHVLTRPSTRLALELASDAVNYRELADLTGTAKQLGGAALPQSGRLRALIFGPPRSLGADFDLEAPSASFGVFDGRSIRAKGAYFGGRINLQKASAVVHDGLIEATGEVDLSKGPSASLEGSVLNVKLDRIPSLQEHGFAAATTGAFRALCRPGGSEIRYRGTLEHGRLGKLAFDQGEVAATYRDGRLEIQELSAETLGGSVAASGEITRDGTLNLRCAGTDINLASIADEHREMPTVGRVHFAGNITGTLESPTYNGGIEAHRIMVSGLGIERIAGTVTASRNALDLDELVIYDYPGTVSLRGRIDDPFGESPGFDLSVKAAAVDAEKIAQALGSPGLTGGSLSGELIVSGSLGALETEGKLHIEGASYRNIAIDALDTRIAYEDGGLRIDELSARSGDSSLTASGEISENKRIAIRFAGSKLALAKFSGFLAPYAFVSGKADISGAISGTIGTPRMELAVSCENPALNGQKFQQFSGKASWDESGLVLSDLTLSDADSEYTIPSFAYRYDPISAEFSVRVKDGDAGKLLALLDASPAIRQSSGESVPRLRSFLDDFPKPLTGIVNADISGGIRQTDGGVTPDLRIQAAAADLKFGSSSIDTVHLEGTWRNKIARLEKLEALDEDTNLYVEGSFGPGNALVLSADAHNLSIDTLRPWLKLPDNFSGEADVTIVAGGSIEAPVSEVYIEVVDPVIAGKKFDRLRTRMSTKSTRHEPEGGKTDLTGKIDIDDLTLTLGDRQLRAAGYVPMDWRRFAIPKDGPISLQSSLDSDSLEVLSAFTGLALSTGPNGTFQGSVRLGGTVQSPNLEGDLTWLDGQAQLPRIESLLENIEASIQLANDKLSIGKLSGTSAEGGSFEIAGDIALADLSPSLNLAIKTHDLGITGRDITNAYGEDITLRLGGDLQVVGDWRSPLISGGLDIPEGLVALPSRVRKSREPVGPPASDPRFAVTASLGRDVQFKSARLRAPLYGKLALAGSLRKPVVEGTLDISDGTILFPMRALRLLPGSTLGLHVGLPPQPAAFLDIRAQARVTAASGLGRRRRYTVTMMATGPLDDLKPTFSSSPPGLSEQTIIALITGQGQLEQILAGDGTSNVGKELSGLFSTAVMPSVFEPIEEAFESILGFEEFGLQMGYREPLQLTIGNRLWDGLYLDYTAAVGARPDYADRLYELKLSYRFKRGLEIGVLTDENRTLGVAIEGKLRF